MNAALGDVSITLVFTAAEDEQKQTICHMGGQLDIEETFCANKAGAGGIATSRKLKTFQTDTDH